MWKFRKRTSTTSTTTAPTLSPSTLSLSTSQIPHYRTSNNNNNNNKNNRNQHHYEQSKQSKQSKQKQHHSLIPMSTTFIQKKIISISKNNKIYVTILLFVLSFYLIQVEEFDDSGIDSIDNLKPLERIHIGDSSSRSTGGSSNGWSGGNDRSGGNGGNIWNGWNGWNGIRKNIVKKYSNHYDDLYDQSLHHRKLPFVQQRRGLDNDNDNIHENNDNDNDNNDNKKKKTNIESNNNEVIVRVHGHMRLFASEESTIIYVLENRMENG